MQKCIYNYSATRTFGLRLRKMASENKHKRFDYLIKEISPILLLLAFSSLAFPSFQRILDNAPKKGFWGAIVVELSTAWPSLLVAFALIATTITLLWKHKDPNDEMNENIRDIKTILSRMVEIMDSKDRVDKP